MCTREEWEKARAEAALSGDARIVISHIEIRHTRSGTIRVPVCVGGHCEWSLDASGDWYPTIHYTNGGNYAACGSA